MEEYYFLFGLALTWIIFGSIQDLKSREVANWLNFSLIAFALFYRAFYSIANRDATFFVFGVAGFAIFFCLAYIFYYAKAFAGGDAKLLMGVGSVLPFESMKDMVFISLGFMLLLFLIGAIYSLFYSIFIVISNRGVFLNSIRQFTKTGIWMLAVSVLLSLTIWVVFNELFIWVSLSALMIFMSVLYPYLKALERCMIKVIPASKLSEGDWLEKDVSVGGKTVKKSVHGLSFEEIKLLRKFNKSVLIKEGVPFVPAFLFAFVITVFFFATLGLNFDWILFSLF